jgi:imidazole glycerol-phosphate synthase subunit HisF
VIPKRIIPVFLLKGSRFFKGTNFKEHIDVGDPLSQSMIYDAQGSEEIVVVDIEASAENRLIDTSLIAMIVKKCRLPIAAGGGIRNISDARKCFDAGADKIIVNSHVVNNPDLAKELAAEFGSQSVVVSIDVKKNTKGGHDVFTFSGTEKTNISIEYVIEKVIENCAGELLVTSIDNEGTMSGFDYGLYKKISDLVPVPLIASGGSGCYDHIVRLFNETGVDACGLGKMLFLRDYDIVRIKAYLKGKGIFVRDA